MYDELERKWKKYRFKKYFKIIASLFFAIFLIFLISFFAQNSNKESSYSIQNKINKQKIHLDKKIEHNISNKNLTKISKKSNKKIIAKNKIVKKETNASLATNSKKHLKKNVSFLTPDYDFEEKLDKIKSSLKEKKRIHNKKHIKNKREQNINEIVSTKMDSKIIIKKSSNKNFINSLIKKFESGKDPKIAIFLSKHYYKEKQYRNSLKWAINANEIDSNNEDSWILFAKSSVKLGKKEDAIKALKIYLSNHVSFKAKVLLDKIETGDFK